MLHCQDFRWFMVTSYHKFHPSNHHFFCHLWPVASKPSSKTSLEFDWLLKRKLPAGSADVSGCQRGRRGWKWGVSSWGKKMNGCLKELKETRCWHFRNHGNMNGKHVDFVKPKRSTKRDSPWGSRLWDLKGHSEHLQQIHGMEYRSQRDKNPQ